MRRIAGAAGAPTVTRTGADGALVPSALVALTVHEYARPVVSALTVMGEAVAIANPLVPPLVEMHCARYDVIGLPLAAPGMNPTLTDVTLGTTVNAVGAPGAPDSVTGDDGADGGLVPIALVAVTVQV
jgi:hypothetical protein